MIPQKKIEMTTSVRFGSIFSYVAQMFKTEKREVLLNRSVPQTSPVTLSKNRPECARRSVLSTTSPATLLYSSLLLCGPSDEKPPPFRDHLSMALRQCIVSADLSPLTGRLGGGLIRGRLLHFHLWILWASFCFNRNIAPIFLCFSSPRRSFWCLVYSSLTPLATSLSGWFPWQRLLGNRHKCVPAKQEKIASPLCPNPCYFTQDFGIPCLWNNYW